MKKEDFERYVFKLNNAPTIKNARKSFHAMRKEVKKLQKENESVNETLKAINNIYICSDYDIKDKVDNLGFVLGYE